MDRSRTLALYDAEMRRDPPVGPGDLIERSGSLVRVVGPQDWIAYSRLTAEEAPVVVEREAARIRGRGLPVEWKVYGHDGPPGLPGLLAAKGFVADPPETLMALDLDHPFDTGPGSDRVTVQRIEDAEGLEAAVRVSALAFSPAPGWELATYLPRLADPGLAIFLARVDGVPVSAGRLDLPAGRSFASLWGGGTLPGFRGMGIYRALVAARAELARTNGFRYLTVDALETSRPILERVGFHPLTTVVGWVLTP